MIRGRYAPSPTGYLHLGNARTAMLAYLHARAHGGQFVMRVEDLDRQRSKAHFIEANLAELRWLGLNWDEGPEVGGPYGPYLQSQRESHYKQAFDQLMSKDLLFACYLSRKDLKELASAPHGAQRIYGRQAKALNDTLRTAKETAGKIPSYRLQAPDQRLEVNDLLHGTQTFDVSQEIGHMVLKRADGMWAYQLAVVSDDHAMNISHVLRGDDLLASSGAQVLLYKLLGFPVPVFIHVPLLLDSEGERMAKRKGSQTLTGLREQGIKAEKVVAVLAHSLGLIQSLESLQVDDLIAGFSLDKIDLQASAIPQKALAWMQT